MSKAFTKEEEGTAIGQSTVPRRIPRAAFRLTREGARKLERAGDERSREALQHAELVVVPSTTPERAALGVSVEVSDERGEHHVYRLVSPEERALLDEGCSVDSPIGRALLGGTPGDVREVTVPRGAMELEILALRADAGSGRRED